MLECWNSFFNSTGTTKLTYSNYVAYSKRKAWHFSYLCKAFLLSNCLWAASSYLTAVLGSTMLILLLVCPSGFNTCFCFGELLSTPHLHTRLSRTHLLRTQHWMWIFFVVCWFELSSGVIKNRLTSLKKKKRKILPFARTRMDSEGIIPREISQTEKHKYCMISLVIIRNLKNTAN